MHIHVTVPKIFLAGDWLYVPHMEIFTSFCIVIWKKQNCIIYTGLDLYYNIPNVVLMIML